MFNFWSRRLVLAAMASMALLAALPSIAGAQYQREADVAPTEEDIGEGYKLPEIQRTPPRPVWWGLIDSAALAAALAASGWIVLRRRRRAWLVVLTIGSLLYFGFFREGCVCPIGAIQNVSLALADPAYAVPYVVIFFFFLPLAAALFFGRVFCGGVCPLGAIQDLVLLKPLRVPRRLDKTLGLLKYIYLALAVWFVLQPAASRDFIICRFDPFVGIFRRTGPSYMLAIGGGLLALGLVIGRPYCRYLCPYGCLLAILSRLAPRGVTITPDEELDCGLCVDACPFGAIEKMRAVRANCLFCARCYPACPREDARRKGAGGPVGSSEAAAGSARSLETADGRG